jgi:hypothetical protein
MRPKAGCFGDCYRRFLQISLLWFCCSTRTLLCSLVGSNIIPETIRNGADGQSTDVRGQAPTKATYAHMARMPMRMAPLRVRGA